jgi:FkbM family methyltransferase
MIFYRLRLLLPESAVKNKIRCFYYNHLIKTGFRSSYKKGHFNFIFKDKISIKCRETIWDNTAISLSGYLARYRPQKGDVVIDCGAGRGEFAIYAAKLVGNQGKVIAFEPDKVNYQKLLENIKLNELSNVVTLTSGVWSKDAKLKFCDQHSDYSSFMENSVSGSATEVDVINLSNEMKRRGIGKVNFIKMDIEGAEIEAIKGCKQILMDNNVHLAIATYHIVDGQKTCHKIEEILRQYGYKAETAYPEHLTTYGTKII